ncbi:MAG TPA: cobalamin biosynthesis protein [Devosia sp.]
MMTNDRPILIGLGCSTSADADEVLALVQACLVEANCQADQIVALASHTRKAGSRALADAADYFGLPLLFLDDEMVSPNIASTCESVAAAAGPLLLAKRKSRFATCAIAQCTPSFTQERLVQPGSANAAIAASMSATSVAGP